MCQKKMNRLFLYFTACLLVFLATPGSSVLASATLENTEQTPAKETPKKVDDLDDDNIDDEEIDDPFEFVNRLTFGINQSIDAAILRPIALGYQGLIPQSARNSVSNFIENAGEPLSFLNHFFQQSGSGMSTNVKRLFINTFMGFFGIFDVASEVGIKPKKQRFMDTLSKAEVGPGPYFVIPIFGPSNLRDAIGLTVDWFTDPFGWAVADRSDAHVYAWIGIRIIDARAKLMNLIDSMNRSKDPYIRYRFMYSEFRRSANADTASYESPVPQGAAKIVFSDDSAAESVTDADEKEEADEENNKQVEKDEANA